MSNQQRRTGKKGRKYGRNKTKCERYKTLRKYELSHIKRLLKHIEKYKDTSDMVKNALHKYQGALKIK
ncbi:MAG TPA: hypothetical protein VMW50_06215 [Dehalococcoidia bacterium]|nr:hypothetical protein [Dehalococcoidia bacterium]